MKRKLILFPISTLILALFFSGCGSTSQQQNTQGNQSNQTTQSTPTEEIYISVISKGFQHQFWQAVKQGVEKASIDLKVKTTFEGPEGEAQIDKQIEMVNAASNKNPKAICIAAIDNKALIPVLQKVKEKNIAIIGFDSGVDGDVALTTCSTDNVAAAALAADKMAELLNKKGEVAVIAHDQKSSTGIDRRDGFVNQMKAKYPDIKLVDIQYSTEQAKAADLAKELLQKYPNLKGIFGTNEGAATGTIRGVTEAKMEGKVVVIGYDAGKTQKEAVKAGIMAGAITQDPVNIGYKAVEAAVKAIKGEKLPKNIDTGFKWYDKTNMDQDVFKSLLYD